MWLDWLHYFHTVFSQVSHILSPDRSIPEYALPLNRHDATVYFSYTLNITIMISYTIWYKKGVWSLEYSEFNNTYNCQKCDR